MKKKLLFLDDRSKRLHAALVKYGDEYDVTLCANAKECLRLLSGQDWHVVSLDFDLDGDDFEDPDSGRTAFEVARYITRMGWPERKPKPRFIVHSSNAFAGTFLTKLLLGLDFRAEWERFEYPEDAPQKAPVVGFVAGAFDILHPGYIAMFREAKEHCDELIVAVHDNPQSTRPDKEKPIIPLSERMEIVRSIRYVDGIVYYRLEDDLVLWLEKIKPDVRFLGEDYRGKPYTGDALNIPIHYCSREHGWSETKLKRMIRNGEADS